MNSEQLAFIIAAVRKEIAKVETDLSKPLRYLVGPEGKEGPEGREGPQGRPGIDGRDGLNGIDGQHGLNGKDGKDGKDGVDGKDGRDGVDGLDGTGISDLTIRVDGHLIVTLDDGTIIDAGLIRGERGPRGPRGPSGSGGGSGSGAAAWGGITGTLSDQTDLQTALNGKQPVGSYATTSQLPITGTATLTVPNNALEDVETVAAAGMTSGRRVDIWLAPHTDNDENSPELLDIGALQAAAGTDQITVTASFLTPTSGPIKLQWSAY